MLFNELGLSAELLRAVEKQGYSEATPIQQQAIPLILEGRDILAGAQTGTGKTAGFTLPMLQLLRESPSDRPSVRALILTPTRELAAQVVESVREYGHYLPFRFRGDLWRGQYQPTDYEITQGCRYCRGHARAPARSPATQNHRPFPASRCWYWMKRTACSIWASFTIFRRILKVLPEQRQNLLFSATFSRDIRRLAAGLLNAPTEIQVRDPQQRQRIGSARSCIRSTGRANANCCHIALAPRTGRQVLVFTRTKHGANRLAQQLTRDGLNSEAIHGNKSQGARTRTLGRLQGR